LTSEQAIAQELSRFFQADISAMIDSLDRIEAKRAAYILNFRLFCVDCFEQLAARTVQVVHGLQKHSVTLFFVNQVQWTGGALRQFVGDLINIHGAATPTPELEVETAVARNRDGKGLGIVGRNPRPPQVSQHGHH